MTFDFNNLPSDDADVIQHHSRSFSLAARLLPLTIRSDVEKLYAWCRWCDDAVDEASDAREAKKRIELLREDVHRIYAGQVPRHAASNWLGSVVNKHGIPSQLPLDLLSGMETDLNGVILQTVDELLDYCYQAAGTVGLMMCRIMGVTDARALKKAKAMGMAMQLTNIARDIDEDWQSGRRYVPHPWLSLVPKKDMTPDDDQVKRSVRELLQLADELYREGYEGLKYLPNGARTAIRVAGRVYQEIGNEIRNRDFSVMQGRVFVPLKRKLVLVVSCSIEEIGFRFSRLQDYFARPQFFSDFLPADVLIGNSTMSNETRYLGYLGISLTFVMATTLFFLMGLNPKATVYSSLPWFYSGICATIAAVTGGMARRINRQLSLQSITQTPSNQR
jgi:phytoene synthase